MTHYLNLDNDYRPFGIHNQILADIDTFKGGEEKIRIHNFSYNSDTDDVWIVVRANDSSRVMRILMANDALQRMGFKSINLFMPYLPYARQDKVMVPGESLSIKVFCNLINSCNFNKVKIIDPHSLVGPALLNNCEIMSDQYNIFIHSSMNGVRNDSQCFDSSERCVVSPDAGSYKKIFETCKNARIKDEIVMCNKVRNLQTNDIEKLFISGEVQNKVCVIIDDICDGGRTFIEIAKQLKERGAAKVYLIVTHGIFSYGEEVMQPYIDHVWSTNSFREYESNFITFLRIAI